MTFSERNSENMRTFFSVRNTAHLEQFTMSLHRINPGITDIGHLRSIAESVVAEWELSKWVAFDYNEWAQRLMNAVRIKAEKSVPKPGKEKQTPKNPFDEYIQNL